MSPRCSNDSLRTDSNEGKPVHPETEEHAGDTKWEHVAKYELNGVGIFGTHTDSLCVLVVQFVHVLVEEGGVQELVGECEDQVF